MNILKAKKKASNIPPNSIAIHDKNMYNWSYYIKDASGISIKYEIQPNDEINFNEIYIDDEFCIDVEDAYHCLDKKTKFYTQQTLLIYTFDLQSVKLLFHDYIKQSFGGLSASILPYDSSNNRFRVEFRSITSFIDSYESAKKDLNINDKESIVVAKYAQKLFDDIFIKERKFWVTPHQRSRHKLLKLTDGVAEQNFPSWSDYKTIRCKCFRGGTCFNIAEGIRKTGDYVLMDKVSAYIAELMLRKYPVGKWESADPEKLNDYSDSDKYAYYCHITFDFEIKNNYIEYLHIFDLDVLSKKADLWVTDIALNILDKNLDITNLKCLYLRICEKDYLPKYFVDFLYDAYIEKVIAKEKFGSDSFKYIIAKLGLNPIYGNLILNKTKIKEYNELTKATRPEWGVWCTDYQRYSLIEFSKACSGSIYGDTDSNVAKNNKATEDALDNYNKVIRKQLKALCERNGYDYNIIIDLGTFEAKCEIVDFIALKTKQYGYIDKYNNEHIVCSGYDKGTIAYQNLLDDNMPEITIQIKVIYGNKIYLRKVNPIIAAYIQAKSI